MLSVPSIVRCPREILIRCFAQLDAVGGTERQIMEPEDINNELSESETVSSEEFMQMEIARQKEEGAEEAPIND